MATFYLLPPRECLEQAVAEFVNRIIPGLPVPPSACEALLTSLVSDEQSVYFVHREDLPGVDSLAELCVGFGAEPGDRVIEIGLASGQRPAAVRHTTIPRTVSVNPSAR